MEEKGSSPRVSAELTANGGGESLPACPRSLEVVAVVFMFGTMWSWSAMVAKWLGGVFSLDVGAVIGLFLVTGLLKGRSFWRKASLVFVALGAALWLVGLGLLLSRYSSGTSSSSLYVFGRGLVTAAHALVIVVVVSGLVLQLWMWRVLRSDRVRDFFRGPERAQVPGWVKPWWVATGIVAVVLTVSVHGVKHLENPEDTYESWGAGGRRIVAVETGYRFGRLAYVVFQDTEGSVSTKVYTEMSGKARLKKPDGGRIRLPNSTQLYEFVDGELRTSPVWVTREQFQAFERSQPDHYSIDALLSFTGAPGRREW